MLTKGQILRRILIKKELKDIDIKIDNLIYCNTEGRSQSLRSLEKALTEIIELLKHKIHLLNEYRSYKN